MSQLQIHNIKVTKEDIASGVRAKDSKSNCFDCALAYAIMRDMNLPYRNVSVAETIRLSRSWEHIELPKWLKRWVIAFDKGQNVPEIEFSILIRRAPLKPVIISADFEDRD